MLLALDELMCEPAESLQSVNSDSVVCGWDLSINPNHETSKPRPGLTVTKDVSSPFLLV